MKALIIFLFPLCLAAQTWDQQHPDTTVTITATAYTVQIDISASDAAMFERAGVKIADRINGQYRKAKMKAEKADPVTVDLRTLETWEIPLDAAMIQKLKDWHGIENKRQYRKTVKKTDL